MGEVEVGVDGEEGVEGEGVGFDGAPGVEDGRGGVGGVVVDPGGVDLVIDAEADGAGAAGVVAEDDEEVGGEVGAVGLSLVVERV